MISPISSAILDNPVSQVKPLNYAIQNETAYSDVFATESTKQTQGVNAVPPVMYPNAQATQVSPVDKLIQAQETDAQFNNLAASFNGETTGYTSSSKGTSYDMLGSKIDLYA